MNALNIILQPVISEKSLNDVGKSRFTFKVARNTNKTEIKKAVEEKFKVNVLKVSTISLAGKEKQIRTRTKVAKVANKPFKKAVVTLKEGQKIAIFESGK
ncbi:MAG: 50S ribosomal protein L23 [Candidatus Levybacteria bacterium RIFCSPLOWO2_01_FULL_36_13]|nr:MAG: 50S ribosomal protein L23 [Candidatus Levybacteria bacterium RIFCSPHIGHO2_01_FULL_36_15b]OGH35015.1 MAG: 50S ribosomal protein L23 [Candidatus Levybacteria bacterium RIFCSPLOWO2_01_FULL_36_13]